MSTLTERREREEAVGRDRAVDRWLAVSAPLAIDEDPEWSDAGLYDPDSSWEHEHIAA